MAEKKELTLEALQKKLDAMEKKMGQTAAEGVSGGQKQALLERKLHQAMVAAKKDTVKLLLPLLDGEDDDTAVCGVNGVLWQVKRGEEVEVPRCVAEVFHNAEKQKKEARERRQALQKKEK